MRKDGRSIFAIGRYSQLVDAIVRVWHAWIGWVACEPGMARNRFAVPVIKNIYRPLVMGPGLLMVLWFSLWVFWFSLGVAVGTVSD